MKLTIFGAALVLACAQAVAGLMIDTPSNVVECEPVLLSWGADPGTGPYYLSVIPGGQPTAPALKTFSPMTDTSYTWKVDIQAGIQITIALKDSTGATAYTDQVMIQAGSDRSCENGVPSTGSGGATSATSTYPGGASTAGPTSSGSPTSSASSASGSARPTGSQAAVASARPSGAASRVTSVSGGFVGFLALVGALIL